MSNIGERKPTNNSTCVICGQKYTGYGNDARPVKEGRCCNGCNLTVVAPRRIAMMTVNNKSEDSEGKSEWKDYLNQEI